MAMVIRRLISIAESDVPLQRPWNCLHGWCGASWGMPLQQHLDELERLVAQIVQESGRPDGFDARQWVERWISEPLPAFAGERPLDVLARPGGLERVRTALLRIQSGAYS